MFLGQEVSTLIDLSIWEGPLLCAQPWYTFYGRLLMFSRTFWADECPHRDEGGR